MNILKISGIEEERKKQIEYEIYDAKQSLEDLVNVLYENIDNIKSIEILEEGREQTQENVISDAKYIVRRLETFYNDNKKVLDAITTKFDYNILKKDVKVDAGGKSTADIFKNIITSNGRKIIDNFSKISNIKKPKASAAGDASAPGAPASGAATPTKKVKDKEFEITFNDGRKMSLLFKTAKSIKATSNKKQLKIDGENVDISGSDFATITKKV